MDMEVDKETVLSHTGLDNSYRAKLSHRDFRLSLIRDLIQEGGRVLGTHTTPQGMPNLSASQFDMRHILHWLMKGKQQSCRVFCKKQIRKTHICPKRNVALYVMTCTPNSNTNTTIEKKDYTVGKYHFYYVLIFYVTNCCYISEVMGCEF
jgi:hypothetical protein